MSGAGWWETWGRRREDCLLDWFAHRVPRFFFPFFSYMPLRQFLTYFFPEPQLFTALFVCKYVLALFSLLFTTETLEIFLYSCFYFFQNYLHSERKRRDVWETRGASGKLVAFFFFVLCVFCFKYRTESEEGGESGRGEAWY